MHEAFAAVFDAAADRVMQAADDPYDFDYLGQEPAGPICYDLRPELRCLTARDAAVRRTVMRTDGIRPLVHAMAATVDIYLAGPRQDEPLTVAVGCASGRHRSATVTSALATVLSGDTTAVTAYLVGDLAKRCAGRGLTVGLRHRDLDKDVVERHTPAPHPPQEEAR
ncbi:hypothetical protein ACH4FX_41335 [Streptomyces sp. NPDC018019]|uniref:RapZ C-terminal domain-containing protein n=1 Tax=Streptomyces sp. NPDC018019 TaxID=3365030 RepID=UPI0037942637